MVKTAEVIIIGGGIIGCAAAYNLAKKGISVLVLEKNKSIGNGASSRNGGGVRQSGRDPRELPLAMYGIENLWPYLSEELGVNVEYHKEGNLRLGKSERHRRILEGLRAVRSVTYGLDVKMIDGEEVRQINPWLTEEIICASWCPTDGHANPLTTTLGYYKRARELGVCFLTGEEVVEIRKVKGRAGKVITKKQVYEGGQIILASGYESRALARTAGLDIPMKSVLIEALVTEAEPQMFAQMLGTADADFYGHQTEHGSFVFGGSSRLEETNLDYGGMSVCSNTAPGICRGIMEYIPRLSDTKVVRTWAGFEDVCIDGVPVIGETEEIPGLILACAFTGHGFGIAPAAGLVLSQIAAGEKPVIELSALQYSRFQQVGA